MNVFTNQQLIQQDKERLIHPLHHQGMHPNGLVGVRGKGAILEDADGNEYLDGLAGLWNNTPATENKRWWTPHPNRWQLFLMLQDSRVVRIPKRSNLLRGFPR